MSHNRTTTNEVSADEQAYNKEQDPEKVDGIAVVDESIEFRPNVEQETQAKVDANHPDGIVQEFSHLPLAQEERIRAREAELDRISAQAILDHPGDRAERTRDRVVEQRRERRRAQRHPDPRGELAQDELAMVNRAAQRIVERLMTDHSRAAVSRMLARRVMRGQDVTEAVFATMDTLKASPGVICPIEDVPDVRATEVSVSGRIEALWEPSSPKIEQVGLIADETGRTKFTSWMKSDSRIVREGEQVRMRAVKKNWHHGRCSLAVTYDSMIVFPERDDRWWEE